MERKVGARRFHSISACPRFTDLYHTVSEEGSTGGAAVYAPNASHCVACGDGEQADTALGECVSCPDGSAGTPPTPNSPHNGQLFKHNGQLWIVWIVTFVLSKLG